MHFEQTLQSGSIEIFSLNGARLQQKRTRDITKSDVTPKPITGGHAKSVFLLLQNGFRQKLLERLLEDVAFLRASDFECSGNSTGQLRQGAIQIRIKNF